MRTVLAVVVGVVTWGVVNTVLWMALLAVSPDAFGDDRLPTTTAMTAALLVLSFLCSIAAGFVAAKIAQGNPGKAVWILAVVNLLIGIAVEVSQWDALPVWYHLGLILMVIPFTLLGGRLAGTAAA
ncbi:MAG: hypothetical protein AAF481_10945 [Acidobacteriota bacterium]